jgi:hypothetical protein
MNEEQTHQTKPNNQGTQPLPETPAQCNDLVEFARRYIREKPGVVALWCLGVGFVLGWKLKPW